MRVDRWGTAWRTTAGPTRVEICPPALQGPPLGWRQRLLDWLAGSWPVDEFEAAQAEAAQCPDDDAIDPVRIEFAAALIDIATPEATDLVWRIRGARSLRELWHLRTELFNAVARHAGQAEATARLQPLNRHFPVRTSASGFGGFDADPQARKG